MTDGLMCLCVCALSLRNNSNLQAHNTGPVLFWQCRPLLVGPFYILPCYKKWNVLMQTDGKYTFFFPSFWDEDVWSCYRCTNYFLSKTNRSLSMLQKNQYGRPRRIIPLDYCHHHCRTLAPIKVSSATPLISLLIVNFSHCYAFQ